jgi:hypothetical protein
MGNNQNKLSEVEIYDILPKNTEWLRMIVDKSKF